ncbi:MAG: enoyl-CoA hydratase [Rhodobacteraceae bacterium]|jgi:enoyl-CoA hydratase|uniref:3-hydroxyisobutyryl-CoA hydrolase n=1 Tax=Salipiger profundus TaxID=1229727 RepID=A0A1U7D914_9RHOB|nr:MULTISPECIES: enoyl-CoA hydratase/isomerase family protein [Salipiger]APX24556.1 enoyl-CoA hydratase [Salipiger profundus]MAB06552.1 enoyl-CoA hydratase [Paracoccaceae bacterium]GFZ96122.1 enoyl-CoA hydratase [Salipiger profundus]SFB83184.1 enoyl-CoA hydratase [Salipiger profundus]
MTDIHIRKQGRAGRITLTRPRALNALTYDMCMAIEAALDEWRDDDAVSLVLLDAEGDKAFCAGGDIAEIYRQGKAGDFDTGRRFWRDEYRMNAKLAEYAKPIVSFLNGFVMGGGVGLGGHVSHRVVGESAQIAMPECGIGFVPDVGGSLLLSRAPGRLGVYLGLTAARMGPADALHANFADVFLPEEKWEGIKTELADTGDLEALEEDGYPLPESPLAAAQPEIDRLFAAGDLAGIATALEGAEGELAARARKAVGRNSPLSMAVTLEMLRRLRAEADPDIRTALRQEYRVSHRIASEGDFLEGVRAQIIDKDRDPHWRLALDEVTPETVAAMLAPLGEDELAL